MLLLVAALAHATPGFDPTAPAARFTGAETRSHDDSETLWSAIERLEDPDRTLFGPAERNDALRRRDDDPKGPHLATCFGSETPGTHAVLLHLAPGEATATGTPVVLVHGAADNATRAFAPLASHLDALGRPVYAVTFAHPHGDAFEQAEALANAIARVRHRTGAEQVDLVAHSKGGLTAWVYLANAPGTPWPDPAYEAVGTRYRGDVRRAVFVGAPLAGLDVPFRWPSGNLASLDAATAAAPSSWQAHYPSGTGAPAVRTDLRAQDLHADAGDLFPGQRQLLARQPHPLPGASPWLGAYALQPDWYTTYEGGLGYVSESRGIDAAIADGGGLVAHLSALGIDPGVEVHVLAGRHPILPGGTHEIVEGTFGEAWADMSSAGADAWGALTAELVSRSFPGLDVDAGTLQGLASGRLVYGEISGESDGLLFVSSAVATDHLTARGAVVGEVEVMALNHLELVHAGPAEADRLLARADDTPADAWMHATAARWRAEDAVGWIAGVLDDDAPPAAPDDTDTGAADDDTRPDDTATPGSAGCRTSPGAPGGWTALLALSLAGRARRRAGAGTRRAC